MKVLKVPCLEKPEVADMTWEEIKEYLFGYVECVTLQDGACLLCYEEAKLHGMRPNRRFGKDIICIDFIIAGTSGENFGDLTDEQVKKYSEMFKEPEFLFKPPYSGSYIIPHSESTVKEYVKYELWQADSDSRDYLFMPYKLLKDKRNLREHYHKVYTGMENKFSSTNTILDSIFHDHNCVIQDRRGHSMSVSDVVVLYNDNGTTDAFYTDRIGFEQIQF